MGEKDILEKGLLEYDDVYMDVIKVLLGIDNESYDELERLNPHSIYKDNSSKIREQERDVFKALKKDNVRLFVLGVENQSTVDYNMPFRILRYDGIAYEDQMYEKEKGLFPVITIVLYFGKKHWTAPKKLSEKIHVPEVIKPYFNDYKVNVFEVSYLTDEQVNMFKSDFGILADFFVQKRKTGGYIPNTKKIVHKKELLMLLSVLTGDKRYNDIKLRKGGEDNMCEVLDYYIGVGEKRGLLVGIRILLEEGYTVADISRKMQVEEKFVEDLLKE